MPDHKTEGIRALKCMGDLSTCSMEQWALRLILQCVSTVNMSGDYLCLPTTCIACDLAVLGTAGWKSGNQSLLPP